MASFALYLVSKKLIIIDQSNGECGVTAIKSKRITSREAQTIHRLKPSSSLRILLWWQRLKCCNTLCGLIILCIYFLLFLFAFGAISHHKKGAFIYALTSFHFLRHSAIFLSLHPFWLTTSLCGLNGLQITACSGWECSCACLCCVYFSNWQLRLLLLFQQIAYSSSCFSIVPFVVALLKL